MSLLRNFATVGGATLASRVLGFVRDILFAAALGVGPVADAFVVAFRFPNLFRRLFAEGAFNSAFIPLFSRRLEGEGRAEASRFASEAMAGLITVLATLTAIAMIAMPVLMYALAPGFSADPDKFGLAVELTRITFPYLALVSLLALISGVLNGLGRFAAAAFAPVLLNVVLIAVLAYIVAAGLVGQRAAGVWLSFGVIAGGIAQLAMVVIALRREGFPLGFVRPRWNGRMKRLVTLGIPGVIAGGITQINIVVGTIIASMQAGAVTLLYLADRLYQLPLGVVGIAIGVVLLPELSRQLKVGNGEVVRQTEARALQFSMMLTLPAAVALAVVPVELVSVLFERVEFTAEDTAGTAAALRAFAIGLPAFVLVKVFSPGFFAREDTATPMKIGAVAVAVNIGASLALFPILGHVGIALATSLAGWVNALLLYALLNRRGLWTIDASMARLLGLMALSAVLMGACVMGAAALLAEPLARTSPLPVRVGALAVVVGTGIVSFFAIAHLTGAARLGTLRRMLVRKA
ncbi:MULTISPECIES: murein biosynthesis integral membrane protein MurJ [unclassified Roseitalea]|uniref:murein biosynthesis integral membrane protein MurJ n=1 Tax=unclassified Roseitalea TaxID=2639107 RepID=UPI00273FA7B3|nr:MULTISPECIES: murein biosynthesis integral membrane protein MurJ [unclassified Roseitalea]